MTRVAVVGNGGSGKTWLALRLADALHIPVVHLDLPVVVCLAGVLGRQVRHRGRRVEDASHTDRFDRGFVHYVATFRHQMRPRVLARLVASKRPVIRARTRRQVRDLADRVARLGPAADLITALRPSEGFR